MTRCRSALFIGLLALPGLAGAEAPSSRHAIAGLAGVSVVTEPCGLIGAALEWRIWRALELGAELRGSFGSRRQQLDGAARLGWGFRRGALRLLPAVGIGAAALHGLKDVWAAALLLSPRLELGWQLRRWQLRVTMAGAFYFNQIWIAAWEPSAGVAYTF